jgi:hypothetical protein
LEAGIVDRGNSRKDNLIGLGVAAAIGVFPEDATIDVGIIAVLVKYSTIAAKCGIGVEGVVLQFRRRSNL